MEVMPLLKKAQTYLRQKGIENPRLTAEFLLAHCLGFKRIDLYLNYDRPLNERELSRYRDLLVKRARHYPLQYLTGEVEFCSARLNVAPGVFIPRPETEVLVEKVKEAVEGAVVVADIGTGCGVIAISLAKDLPQARFFASDISAKALKLAQANAARNGVAERIKFLLGDLLDPFQGMEGKLDAVVSNPPYIPQGELESLPAEVRLYEPKAALDGGKGGREVQKRLIAEAWPYLKKGGILALEVGESQARVVRDLMEGRYERTEVFPDLNGSERVVMGRKA
jgi:release factor glutamine methyltransferase